MTRHNDTPYAKPMTRTLGRETLSKGPQAQSLIFVLTTYALDPNRAALTRLLIDLGQKFMLVPIERFTDKPLSNATTDLILIDALHLSHAGHEHRLTHLLNEHPGARAVVSDTFNPRLSPNPKRLVSHRQLAHELHSSPESFNRSGPEKAPTEISNQMLSRQASPKVPQAITQPASDLALMPGKTQPMFDQKLAIERVRGQPALAMELYHLLKTSLSQDLADLESAVRNDDLRAAQRALHKLSGALALTGARQLEQTVELAQGALKTGGNLTEVRHVILKGEQLLALMTHDPWETTPA